MQKGVARAVIALGAVAGLAGYVLLIGGLVVWLRLDRAGLPAEAGVSAMPHDELFVYGIETIAAWLLLLVGAGIAYAAFAVAPMLDDRREVIASGVVGVLAGFALFEVTGNDEHAWWVAFAVAVLVWAWAIANRARSSRPLSALKPLLFGLLIGVQFFLFFTLGDDGRVSSLVTAAVIFVLLIAIGWLLERRRSFLRRIAPDVKNLERGQAQLRLNTPASGADALEAELRRQRRELMENRHPKGPERLALLDPRFIYGGLVAFGLLVLGAGAVAVQLDRAHAFASVFVRLENGRCISGAYFTRTGSEIIVAGRMFGNDRDPTLLSLRREEVAELHVRNPRGEVPTLRSTYCRRALAKTPDAAPGPAGPKGAAGPKGPVGPKGPRGPRGPRGRR